MPQPRVLKISDSSNVSIITYNPESEVMVVQFTDGSIYRYVSVPGDVVGRVAFSKSVGKALRKLVISSYEGKQYK